jgi:hypothetical protein
MDHDSSARGMGGLLVAIAAGMIAEHIGMPSWKVISITLLVGIGLPLCVGGRWQNW